MDELTRAIADLTERVSAALAATGQSVRADRLAQQITDALFVIFDRYTLDQLEDLRRSGELDQAITGAVSTVVSSASADLAADVAARSSEAIRAAAEFYAARGIDPVPVSEAVRRSDVARRIGAAFDTGMSQIGTTLYEATRDLTLDAVARGEVSRSLLEQDILDRTGVTEHNARTQAQVAVGAYAEAWTEELARQAELGHLHYAGTLKANSRHFCRAHLDRVFSVDQVELMDNGQGLLPVRIFRGGYRCRHRWTPVDPDWSPSLRARLVPADAPATRVQLDRAGQRFITVVLPADELPRLQRQVVLARAEPGGGPVYTVFENAAGNPTGFRAYHGEWLRERLDAHEGSQGRADLDRENDVATALADRGDEALLPAQPPTIVNLRGGNVDVVWNGRPAEIKTPTALDAGSLSRPLKHGRQADLFIISLTAPLTDEPEAWARLDDWLRRHPGKEIWIIRLYDHGHLEGPFDDRRRPPRA